MARRRRRTQRDNTPIANRRLLRSSSLRAVPDLRLLEDRRQFYPDVFRPARGLFSWSADVVASEPRKVSRRSDLSVPFRLAFRKPSEVVLCARRHRRREVLFALRRTGKGSRSRRRRRNAYSDVRC